MCLALCNDASSYKMYPFRKPESDSYFMNKNFDISYASIAYFKDKYKWLRQTTIEYIIATFVCFMLAEQGL